MKGGERKLDLSHCPSLRSHNFPHRFSLTEERKRTRAKEERKKAQSMSPKRQKKAEKGRERKTTTRHKARPCVGPGAAGDVESNTTATLMDSHRPTPPMPPR